MKPAAVIDWTDAIGRRRCRALTRAVIAVTRSKGPQRHDYRVARAEEPQGEGERDEHVAHRPPHHGRARHRERGEGPDADVPHERGLHVVGGQLPERLAGDEEARPDPDVARGRVARERADLLHPAADEGEAVEAEDGHAVREGREAGAAEERQGQQHRALEQEEREAEGGVRRGVAADEARHEQHAAAQERRVEGQDRPAAEPLAEGDRPARHRLRAERLDDAGADLPRQRVHGDRAPTSSR